MTTNNTPVATVRITALDLKRKGYTVEKSNGRILCYKFTGPCRIHLYDFSDHMEYDLHITFNSEHAHFEHRGQTYTGDHSPF